MAYHIPALLSETVEALNIRPHGVYVDLTFGGGGHARAILDRLNGDGKLIAFDQDEDAMQNLPDDKRLLFVRSNFCYLKNFLRYHGIDKVDGVLADLGVSFHHFDSEPRGFSFRFTNSRLDMRMNQQATLTAEKILNEYDEQQLADLFFFYGELRNSRHIARLLANSRKEHALETIEDLLLAVQPIFDRERDKKALARLFQALRIEVNREMDTLKSMLQQAEEVLNVGARLAILTYHSLEDRLVKNFMKTGNFEGKLEKDFYGNLLSPLRMINSKATVASSEEVEQNPRSRSAKLRIAQKKETA